MALTSIHLAIGTTNAGKVKAVKEALSSYPQLAECILTPIPVSSGVSDQPKTLAETLTGAKNRAHRAAEAAAAAAGASAGGGVVMGIGMESGLFEDPDGRLCDLTATCIFDGTEDHVGYSCAWALPTECARLVREEGQDLSQAANASGLCNDPQIGEKGGLIGVLTGGRVTRPQYTIQSIEMAILAMNPAHFRCGPAVPGGINDQWTVEAPASASASASVTAEGGAPVRALQERVDSLEATNRALLERIAELEQGKETESGTSNKRRAC